MNFAIDINSLPNIAHPAYIRFIKSEDIVPVICRFPSNEVPAEVSRIMSSPTSGEIDMPLTDKITSLFRLCAKNAWDGLSSTKALKRVTCEKVREFVRLLNESYYEPDIEVSPEGDMVLFWSFGNSNVAMGFYENDEISYTLLKENNLEARFDGKYSELAVKQLMDFVKIGV